MENSHAIWTRFGERSKPLPKLKAEWTKDGGKNIGIGLSSLYRKMDELDIDKRAEPQESGNGGDWSEQGSAMPRVSDDVNGKWPRTPARSADRPRTTPADEDRVIGS